MPPQPTIIAAIASFGCIVLFIIVLIQATSSAPPCPTVLTQTCDKCKECETCKVCETCSVAPPCPDPIAAPPCNCPDPVVASPCPEPIVAPPCNCPDPIVAPPCNCPTCPITTAPPPTTTTTTPPPPVTTTTTTTAPVIVQPTTVARQGQVHLPCKLGDQWVKYPVALAGCYSPCPSGYIINVPDYTTCKPSSGLGNIISRPRVAPVPSCPSTSPVLGQQYCWAACPTGYSAVGDATVCTR